MAFVEHAPYFGPQSEGVWQCLKDDVAIICPVSMPTQGSQTKRMWDHSNFQAARPRSSPITQLPGFNFVLFAHELVNHRHPDLSVPNSVAQFRGQVPLDLLAA